MAHYSSYICKNWLGLTLKTICTKFGIICDFWHDLLIYDLISLIPVFQIRQSISREC